MKQPLLILLFLQPYYLEMLLMETVHINDVHNLENAIHKQREKLERLRKVVKDLKFVPVDPIGHYSCVTYKAIDGGKMNIDFDPFEIEYVEIADSNENVLLKFVIPKGIKMEKSDFITLNEMPAIKSFLDIFNVSSITDISEIYNDPKKVMELAEYACIFEKVINESDRNKFLIMRDGLLRTKALKAEYYPNLMKILGDNKNIKLVGVSKRSRLLSMISSALHLEKMFPPDKTGYIEIPLELELMAYTWSGHGLIKGKKEPLDYALGRLYVAKLSSRSGLLVTTEIPYDLREDKPIYNSGEVNEIFGHLIKDSMYAYPNLGYSQTIMRAHEKAVKIGFTASIIRDKIMDKCLDGLDPGLKKDIRDYNLLKETVTKGTLGGI